MENFEIVALIKKLESARGNPTIHLSDWTVLKLIDALKSVEGLIAQIHNLCHDKHTKGPVTPEEFCAGCEEFQVKLFSYSPITALKKEVADQTFTIGELEEKLVAMTKERDALRVCFAEASHSAGPTTVHVTALKKKIAILKQVLVEAEAGLATATNVLKGSKYDFPSAGWRSALRLVRATLLP